MFLFLNIPFPLFSFSSILLFHYFPSMIGNDPLSFQEPSTIQEIQQFIAKESQKPTIQLFQSPEGLVQSEQLPGNIILSESNKLLDKFFHYHRYAGDVIEVYDRFVFYHLRDILACRQLAVRTGKYNVYGYLFCANPWAEYQTYRGSDNSEHFMTPERCRNEHRTYSVQIKAKLYFYFGPFQV